MVNSMVYVHGTGRTLSDAVNGAIISCSLPAAKALVAAAAAVVERIGCRDGRSAIAAAEYIWPPLHPQLIVDFAHGWLVDLKVCYSSSTVYQVHSSPAVSPICYLSTQPWIVGWLQQQQTSPVVV